MAKTTTPEEFAALIMDSSAGMFRLLSIHLGARLGYYDALASHGGMTAPELAKRAGTDARYAREWLEQQVVSGILDVDDPDASADARTYRLPPAHREVLVDRDSLNYLVPLAQMLAACAKTGDAVIDAHRTGGGVPFEQFGLDMRDGQAAMNRPIFMSLLGSAWLPAMPDIHARLQRPGARVADVGCGGAWSSIAIARAYPAAEVHGFDLDAASVDLARANVAAAGLSGRVKVERRDAADPGLRGRYDLVVAMECIHDMSRPVEALRAMRGLLAEGGALFVVDERVGERFTREGEGLEWMMYGWSILHCLPVGAEPKPSAMTGTVLRPSTMREYSKQAGFAAISELPVAHDLFRLYRLDA